MARQSATRSIDAVIAELAARQHGVVARPQLLAAGVTVAEIEGRVRRGLLIPLHRGVYAVGHALLRPTGHRLAAVLACGAGAALSHRAAGAHLALRRSAGTTIDVTSTRGAGRSRPGLRVHRGRLEPWERTVHDSVPVTTPARTLLDLAEVLPREALRRAVAEAEHQRVFDLTDLERTLDAHRHRPGAARLRALLAEAGVGDDLTRSELEERVLAICDRHGVPRPRVNARVAGLEVDFHWPAARLVVEADGRRFHLTAPAFERDRERDALLLLHGLRVLRLTSRRIAREPDAVGATLRALVVTG
jgi:very-short-patch-repair endonuclease/predicted transcriptional regulator of viral defense system